MKKLIALLVAGIVLMGCKQKQELLQVLIEPVQAEAAKRGEYYTAAALKQWALKETLAHNCHTELAKLLPPGYKLDVNRQYIKVYYASTNEPYRAWTIYYSEGETYDADGNWISLYREPTMKHVDMRNFKYKEEK